MAVTLLTADEAAAILKVSASRMYELIRTGIVPRGIAVRLGRQVRIDADGLSEWIKAGGQALPGGWRREPES